LISGLPRLRDKAQLGHHRDQYLYVPRQTVCGIPRTPALIQPVFLGCKDCQCRFRRKDSIASCKALQVPSSVVFDNPRASGAYQKAWTLQLRDESDDVRHGSPFGLYNRKMKQVFCVLRIVAVMRTGGSEIFAIYQ
jgi:hypothetical protein